MNPDGSLDGTKDDSSNSCEYLDLSVGLLGSNIHSLSNKLRLNSNNVTLRSLVAWTRQATVAKRCLLVAQRCGVRKKKKSSHFLGDLSLRRRK